MTSRTLVASYLGQLVAWLISHPRLVRLAIIIAVVIAATLLSYSVTWAEPTGGGGGGCYGC